jgi:glycosyltransferase involved in cell wall biosynthesis
VSRRRLLFFVYYIGAGGMETQLLHLAHGFATRGDEVTIGCFDPWVDTSRVEEAGVRIVDFGERGRAARMGLATTGMAALARRHDVVHCTGWDASLWGRWAGIVARRPTLVTEHTPGRHTQMSDTSGANRARLIAAHNRFLDPFTYATVAVATPQLETLRAEGVAERKLVVIPNGVPLEPIRRQAAAPPSRASIGVPDDALVVTHVARFEPQKRQDLTYETVARLRESTGKDVHVLFVGRGEERKEDLERRADQDGATWAHFLGVRPDVPALLGLTDLAVLPSSAEALPMVMIEAMAAGVPQVATDVGDVGTVLRGSDAGIVVPPDDADALHDACRRVLTDPELAAKLGRAGLAGAEDFDCDHMVDRYSALFDAAVAGRPPASAGVPATLQPVG